MKTLFKKSFAVFLSAVLLLSVLPFTVSAAEIVDSGTTGDCTWTLDSEGTLTISGNGRMGAYANSHAPWQYKSFCQVVVEEGVTHIGDYAFFNGYNLTAVTIPNSVRSIGNWAFEGCYRLTTVTIPASVTYIGFCAFKWCRGLLDITVNDNNRAYRSIDGNLYNKNGTILIQYALGKADVSFTIPNSVTRIDAYAISNCNRLTSVVIPDSVTRIDDYAFYYSYGLTSVDIPDSVMYIGDYAFFNCNKLTTVTIPNSVRNIGYCAFGYNENLLTITVDNNNNAYCSIDGNLYDKEVTSLIQYAAGKSDVSFSIPDSVTSIAAYAFSECDSLTTVTIPDSVTSIDTYAFYSCNSLTRVTVPDSVTSIGDSAFSDCPILTIYCVKGSYAETYAKDHYIPFVALENSADFTYQVLDDNTVKITGYTGNGGDVVISSDIDGYTVTSIGNEAFADCSSLITVTIPDSVTNIGDEAFADCGSLITVTIPNSVASIGDDAFKNCDNLTIHCITDSCAETYAKNHHIPFIATEDPAHFTYQSAPWVGSRFVEITGYTGNGGDVVIPSVINGHTVTRIGDWAFDGCYNLTAVTIPDSVTSIGDFAFYCCSSLTAVTIPDSVTSIGDFAFTGCSSLTAVTIPDSVLTVGDDVFHGCQNLQQVTLSRSLTEISTGMFSMCWSLTSITIPDSVVSIGGSAFSGCWNLSDITIPDSVTSIGSYAFDSCTLLTSIHIPKNVSMIANNAYAFISGITSITVNPNNPVYDSRNNCNAIIETSSNTLIKGCDKTVIPDTVTSIGENAFSDCVMSTMILPGNMTSISKNAFWWCSSLTSIFIPESVTAIGKDAFYQCNNLTIYGIAGSYAETYANQNNIPFVAVTDFGTTGDCVWWLDSAGILTVSGYGKTANYPNSLNLPWGTNKVKTAVFEDGVTTIGKCAFKNNTGLQSVTIPDSVTAINSFAFYGCTNLQTITIPPSVTSIGDSVFSNCNQLTVCGVKGSYAERYAHQNNIPFTAVCPSCGSTELEVVPAVAATTTQAGATEGLRCKQCGKWMIKPKTTAKLEEEIVDSGTTGDCTWKLDSAGTLTVSGTGKMGNYANSLNLPWGNNRVKAVILEDGVTSIGKCAFKNNKRLQSIIIPDSVTAINSFAFYGCSSLQAVTIPPSVTSIGISSFSYCDALTIFGEKGSYAESYAAQNSIPFVPICPVCGGSEFEAVPGSPSDMLCTHCSDGVVIPSAAPMGAVPFTVGDISGNNDVGIEDATLLQQYLAEMIELDLEDEKTFVLADMNSDGYVNVKDVTAVQRKVAELI